jgi:hypothetical protein
MGLLWKIFAPKELKSARRTVRKVTHPVSAITPRPVKQARRAVGMVTHPIEATEHAAQSTVADAITGKHGSRQPQAPPPIPTTQHGPMPTAFETADAAIEHLTADAIRGGGSDLVSSKGVPVRGQGSLIAEQFWTQFERALAKGNLGRARLCLDAYLRETGDKDGHARLFLAQMHPDDVQVLASLAIEDCAP